MDYLGLLYLGRKIFLGNFVFGLGLLFEFGYGCRRKYISYKETTMSSYKLLKNMIRKEIKAMLMENSEGGGGYRGSGLSQTEYVARYQDEPGEAEYVARQKVRGDAEDEIYDMLKGKSTHGDIDKFPTTADTDKIKAKYPTLEDYDIMAIIDSVKNNLKSQIDRKKYLADLKGLYEKGGVKGVMELVRKMLDVNPAKEYPTLTPMDIKDIHQEYLGGTVFPGSKWNI